MNRKDLIKPDGRRLHLYSRNKISDQITATNPQHEAFVANPHMRWHPLRGEWVVYAAYRQNRTFLPPKEYSPLAVTKSADFPTELPAGEYNVAVFENLFPALSISAPAAPDSTFPTQAGVGVCEVVVFTQNPDISFGQLSVDEIKLVLEVIADRTKEIGAKEEIQYVLPFENRGVEVGVTLHHPHGQIYSYPFVPPVAQRICETQKEFFLENDQTLLQKILAEEKSDDKRIYVMNEKVKAFIPSFARYAYETWIVPERPAAYLYELNDSELQQMAQTLKTVLLKFDRMWNRPFPYLLTIYQAPTDGKPHPEFHTHIQIYPAFRAPDKLKFLAGTELGAGVFVNDSFPEDKAAELKNVVIDFEAKQ